MGSRTCGLGLTAGMWTGSHTIQVMSGCKVDSNSCLLCGYEGYTYDGCNYISLMEDLRTWTEAQITWLEMEQAGNAETQGLLGG